jgi:hypothetical protein
MKMGDHEIGIMNVKTLIAEGMATRKLRPEKTAEA